ncbi:MAG: L,D-transpeptidase family protein [Janthinobacterium lividum]
MRLRFRAMRPLTTLPLPPATLRVALQRRVAPLARSITAALALAAVTAVTAGSLATLPSGLALAAMAAGLYPSSASAAKPNNARRGQFQPDPDVLLINVYRDMAANRLREALAKSDALVQAYPNFQLGQLIRGDLLLMQTHAVTGFGKAAGAPMDKLDDLRLEAMARLKSLRERPDPSLVPRAIVQLRDDQKNVLVVDTRRSRLYMYENQHGQLKLVSDYYVSQGKFGVDKYKEGDGKTPLGVYYITSRLSGARLPEFYGAGALPISYPNEWDRLQGRSGSGIWLHGTPPANFSRAPLASDGCVVLTNQDLQQLYGSIEVLKTPVIISDGVEFVSRAKAAEDRKLAEGLLESWQRDLGANLPVTVRSHYSVRFKSEQGDNLDLWLARQVQPASSLPTVLTMRDVSFFYYPAKDDVIVATFTQDAKTGRNTVSVRKRQYWVREGAQWRIISETSWQAGGGSKGGGSVPLDPASAAGTGVGRLKDVGYRVEGGGQGRKTGGRH